MAELLVYGAGAAAVAGLAYLGTIQGEHMPIITQGEKERETRSEIVRIPWAPNFLPFQSGPADLNKLARNYINNEDYIAWKTSHENMRILKDYMDHTLKGEAEFYEEVWVPTYEKAGRTSIPEYCRVNNARLRAAQVRALANQLTAGDEPNWRKHTNTVAPKFYQYVNGDDPSVSIVPYATRLDDIPYRSRIKGGQFYPAGGKRVLSGGFMSTLNQVYDNIDMNAGVQPSPRTMPAVSTNVRYPGRQTKSLRTGLE
jgi:hypothetical protein